MNVPPQDWQQCRACKADIVFGRTGNMRGVEPVVMPVNVKTDPRGNIILSKQGGTYYAGVAKRNQAAGMRDRGEGLHKPHFATCTQAARFRTHYGDGGKVATT